MNDLYNQNLFISVLTKNKKGDLMIFSVFDRYCALESSPLKLCKDCVHYSKQVDSFDHVSKAFCYRNVPFEISLVSGERICSCTRDHESKLRLECEDERKYEMSGWCGPSGHLWKSKYNCLETVGYNYSYPKWSKYY